MELLLPSVVAFGINSTCIVDPGRKHIKYLTYIAMLGRTKKVKKPSHLSFINILDDAMRAVISPRLRRAVISRLSFFGLLNPTWIWAKLSGSIWSGTRPPDPP